MARKTEGEREFRTGLGIPEQPPRAMRFPWRSGMRTVVAMLAPRKTASGSVHGGPAGQRCQSHVELTGDRLTAAQAPKELGAKALHKMAQSATQLEIRVATVLRDARSRRRDFCPTLGSACLLPNSIGLEWRAGWENLRG